MPVPQNGIIVKYHYGNYGEWVTLTNVTDYEPNLFLIIIFNKEALIF